MIWNSVCAPYSVPRYNLKLVSIDDSVPNVESIINLSFLVFFSVAWSWFAGLHVFVDAQLCFRFIGYESGPDDQYSLLRNAYQNFCKPPHDNTVCVHMLYQIIIL